MRALSVISKVLMWILLVFYLLMQGMAVFGISMSNANAVEGGQADKVYNVIPLIVASVLMLIGVILFTVFKKRRYIGIITCAVSAAVILVIALDLGRAFPVHIDSTGKDVGLGWGKLILNHIGIAMVPLLMLIAWLTERAADKIAASLIKDNKGFDLTGGSIFKDLEDDATQQAAPRKLKRSLRKRLEKQE